MHMTGDTTITVWMAICLALAATALAGLVLLTRWLLRRQRAGARPAGLLWAASLVAVAGLLLIDIVVLWCLIEYGLVGVNFTVDGLRSFMDQAGIWAPLASIGLMAAHSFVPFPAEIIAVANGLVFGVWLGVAVTWLGAMLGAVVAYEVARALGPSARARLLPERHRARLDHLTAHVSIGTLLAVRLIPVISFNLINYATGFARVPRFTFVWTTGVGILPLTVLSVLLGSEILQLPLYVWALAGAAALLLLLATRIVRRANARDIATKNASGKRQRTHNV